jgi:hypothetical protein
MTIPPYQPPPGGGQMPNGYPPQPGYPPPGYPPHGWPPPRRKSPVLAIVLGVVGFVFLVGIVTALGGGGAGPGGGGYQQTSWTLPPGTQPPPPVDLPIENLRQETEVWCWAAVSQQIIMASRGPQNTPNQCALVAMANGASPETCCSGYNQSCVRPGSLQQIQGLVQQFGGRYSSYAAPTDPVTLYNTLAQGHAVILALRSGQGMGHVVVVRGMSYLQTQNGYEPVLHVNDPMAYYTQPIPFGQLKQLWTDAIVIN